MSFSTPSPVAFGRRNSRNDKFVCSPLTPIPPNPQSISKTATPKSSNKPAPSSILTKKPFSEYERVEFQLNIRDETDCIVYAQKIMVPRNQKRNRLSRWSTNGLMNNQTNLSGLLWSIGMQHLIRIFEKEKIDLNKFFMMNNCDLAKIGISLRDRVRLLNISC